jgi:hypothetical protein
MQFETDVDLAAAIASPRLSIRPLLEFDWTRDNTWNSTHAIQSSNMSSVDIDFASIHSDLPSEINAVVGSSSGVMTVKLSGFSSTAGMDATQLWSKYYSPSPLYTFTKEGTPVRYSRIVATAGGPKTIRQFTGWISEYVIDEASGVVTLTCSDVYDLQTSLVSLPVWAIGPDGSESNTPGPSGKVSSMVPIDSSWLYKEVLRQAGRSLWPVIRSDAVASISGDGSMLPSVGELGCALNIPAIHYLTAQYQDIDLVPFQVGKYGLAPLPVSGTQNDDITAIFVRANRSCTVPDRGNGDPNTLYIGFSGWVKSSGSPGATGTPTVMAFYLGSAGSDEGFLNLQLYPGGSFSLGLYESSLSGSSNAGTTRTYGYVSSGNSLPVGWHYLEVFMSFTQSTISIQSKIDGVVVAPTSVPVSTAAYKYHSNYTFEEQTNQIWIQTHDTSFQHFQFSFGFGTPAVGKKDPAYVTAGKPVPARTSFGTNWLTHIPDRFNKYGWDILKEAVEGELGVLITREDGSVWCMGREDVYMYGWLASMGGDLNLVISQAIEAGLSLAWFGVNVDLLPSKVIDLSRDKISGVQYNPSADTFRNAIAYHVDQTKMINAIVWSSNDPKQFYAASGSTNLDKVIGLPSGTVSIYNHTLDVGITPNSNKPPLNQTSISAIQANAPTFAASVGWLASVFWKLGQRSFDFGYGAGILSPGPVYVGASSGGDQANFQIGGWKYDSSDPYDEIWARTVGPGSVSDRGYALLDLGTNDWRQYPPRLRKIFNGLLRDTVQPVPVMRNLSAPPDPRRQLLDVVRLPPSKIVSGDVLAQIVGKRISDTQDSAEDYLDVRVVFGPVEPAYWDVSNWDQGAWTL